jgi:two-component system response regulator QseB
VIAATVTGRRIRPSAPFVGFGDSAFWVDAGADDVFDGHVRSPVPHVDVMLVEARRSAKADLLVALRKLRQTGWAGGVLVRVNSQTMMDLATVSHATSMDFVLPSARPDELLARLRRESLRARASRASRDHLPVRAGVELHWRTREVVGRGHRVKLSGSEMLMLAALVERQAEPQSAAALSRRAWRGDSISRTSRVAGHVCSLRKKLAVFGALFGIRTIRGSGYQFESGRTQSPRGIE